MSVSDDEDETMCPLCVEEMDLSDKNFLPCPCGYRVCIWCWHHIRENMNGLCPACRTPYNSDPHAFSAVDRQEIVKKNKERKQKERNDKKGSELKGPVLPGGTVGGTVSVIVDRRQLHNYRVVQRNLIYIVGIPLGMANEELLRKSEYLGQYGKIGKVVVHRNHTATQTTVSAYVTFVYKEDAKAAIQSLEGYWVDGHLIRASFGTTKYCNNFIRGVPCNNPDCVYLHEIGDDEDRFTKEEIQAGHSKLVPVPGRDQTLVTGNGGPSGTGKKPTVEPVFPPPVFIQDINPTNKATNLEKSSPYWGASPENDENSEGSHDSRDNGINNNSTTIIINDFDSSKQKYKNSLINTGIVDNENNIISSRVVDNLSASIDMSTVEYRDIMKSKSISVDNGNAHSDSEQQKTEHGIALVGMDNEKSVNKITYGGSIGSRRDSAVSEITHTSVNAMTTGSTIDNNKNKDSNNGMLNNNINSNGKTEPSTESTVPTNGNINTNLTKKTETIQNPTNSLSSFNGITRCAVFPVPTSSFSVSIWSAIINASSTDLKIDPYGKLLLPISEFLDLTIPPVDAICNSPWPRPLIYYKKGVNTDGFSHSYVNNMPHHSINLVNGSANVMPTTA